MKHLKNFDKLYESNFTIEWSYGPENSEYNHWRFFHPETDDAISSDTALKLAKEAGVEDKLKSAMQEVENDIEYIQDFRRGRGGGGGTFRF